MTETAHTLRLILGDQLNAQHSWLQQQDEGVLYVLAELHQETAYVQHHVQKVCAFFAAMGAFAEAIHQAGHRVLHLSLDDTAQYADLPTLLQALIKQYQVSQFEYQLPDEYRLRQQLSEMCQDLNINTQAYETQHFYLSEQEIMADFKVGHRHRMEAFYRKMRQRHQVLMNKGEPVGGKWNFDGQNQNKLKPDDFDKVPAPLLFATDVSDILARLTRHQVVTFGKVESRLLWPVTRRQAVQLLDFFCQTCLPWFGQFQDAMTGKLDDMLNQKQWSLFHSRISFALNCKMISPKQVIHRAIDEYDARPEQISIAQIEGFVRQILGWREFVRAIYWRNMPEYGELNALQASRQLPDWFWNGETDMLCLKRAISQSLDYAYAHHIQRLMVTGNFCLLAGIDPDEVDKWYLGVYIDAIEWVEMPNTRGMSQFADGGIVGSKAYAASGNYINKMSDYCGDCRYQVKQAVGDNACPFNALYWHFMVQHQTAFANNPRNKMVYANWRKKPVEQQQAILDQAEHWLGNLSQL
ncbi:cryptochrome/photolyase family protein [Motilimonas pumila]|uniref:Cryptochrome/photolyase family protein n=1 Tax=Motilimonas pumila TaxID=2303987 RepID=A0A418YF79_9GAMM|nr:cryptochrome/photolyase family protein [Motilimonas pumila]RJG47921.1 cryptochrome/photolyase family protein [Motilimonas pumila]